MEEQEKPKVSIEIIRHRQFFEMLRNPLTMWKVLLSLFLILVVFFFGIASVIVLVKSFYPYNSIKTNLNGATIMKDEDKEIIYWLFNPAQLWADSGIEVEVGDQVSIRSSGAHHTAIHHLVDDAQKNNMLRDKWTGTEGEDRTDPVNVNRSRYRMAPNVPQMKLLMNIVAPGDSVLDENYRTGIVEIGRERTNLYIGKKGRLVFAVNDIALTDDVIDKMYDEYVEGLENNPLGGRKLNAKNRGDIENLYKSLNTTKESPESILGKIADINASVYWPDSLTHDSVLTDARDYSFGLGFYPGREKDFPLVNELLYYRQLGFKDAWFVDNVGSILIVIERKTH